MARAIAEEEAAAGLLGEDYSSMTERAAEEDERLYVGGEPSLEGIEEEEEAAF